ncbi:hypothetical protein E1A91_A05G392500v1 [Gossypium mustelinum]|uniref:Uncharacterized protein n=1 Tax=Gossypium mustelinum TaxID=34275 RepID=A0A5D2ZGJ8_GOSMU|nr:hypothetical protein E1A91_A05G392500v1 [Gossypium mustelinum]
MVLLRGLAEVECKIQSQARTKYRRIWMRRYEPILHPTTPNASKTYEPSSKGSKFTIIFKQLNITPYPNVGPLIECTSYRTLVCSPTG